MTTPWKRLLLSLMLGIFILACATVVPPTAMPPPTGTAGPTNTPAPPPTATFVIKLTPDTPVPSQTADPDDPESWACKIRSQAPRVGRFGPKERFDVAWQVENTGWAMWEPGVIRAAYYSGRRLQVNDEVPLRESVPVDTWTLFVVPMVAPRAAGEYTTTWAVWRGDEDLCHMTVTIIVK